MATQALVMGFGGTGAHILTFLKEQAVLKEGGRPESIRFLFFDTIADWQPGETVKILGGAAEERLAKGTEEGTSLDPASEYFYLGDHDPDLEKHVYEYLALDGNHDRLPHLKDWLHAPWLSLNVPKAKLNIKEGAAQQRQIGRFAMFQNAEAIVQQIRQDVRRLKQHASSSAINVWLVGSSVGGTGAGCLLDAAFLTRLATKNEKVNVTGVIVLPEIYAGIEGTSPGRAYSLFRELDRFQQLEFQHSDRFSEGGRDVSFRVACDPRGRHISAVTGKLFDNLFYVGRSCHNDRARTSFFTSVANAIDPFLDETSGPPLLEAALNESAAASSFGAARLYVPVETLASLFAWQEVSDYLEAASAPRVSDNIVTELHHGATEDRQRDGRTKIQNLLPLFKDVLGLAGKTEEELRRFARSLNPQSIVKEWYGFGGAAVAGMSLTPAEEQVARLTFVNPYLSMTSEEPDRLSAEDLITKTYQEHKNANLPKEKKIESRDRFAIELEGVTQRYKNPDAADQSFEKGRRVVFDKLSRHLESRIDQVVLNELQQNPRFGRDPDALDQGTVMTRFFQELKEVLADHGALARIDEMVSTFISALDGEEERHQQEAVRAVKDLKEWAPAGFFGGSVNEPQVAAREASATYIETYQRTRLLRDMQNLVRALRARLQAWAGTFKKAFDALVTDVSHSGYADSRKQLRRFNARLQRLAQNPTARISCASDWDPLTNPDLEMLGYREKLRQECVSAEGGTLAAAALAGSSWELAVTTGAQPQVRLRIVLEGEQIDHDENTFGELHTALYKYFRKTIDERIEARDIFDYLRFVGQPPHNVAAEKIGQVLNEGAEVLINAEASEACRLVFKDPVDQDKRNLTQAILRAVDEGLRNIDVSDSPHSDPHSITLLKIKKPNLESIHNIVECREDYIRWQQDHRNRDEDHDKQLARAQVFHPFRPELEAWFIERRHFDLAKESIDEHDHIPPRIVRLLENPAMAQAFVHCVATGAVKKRDQSWVWHRDGEDVTLTDAEREPRAGLVRVAVVFALQQREGRKGGRTRITLDEARQSAVAAAQARSLTRDDAISDFLDNELDGFLASHCPANGQPEVHNREVAGLRMIFEFYGHPGIRTPVADRLDLSYQV